MAKPLIMYNSRPSPERRKATATQTVPGERARVFAPPTLSSLRLGTSPQWAGARYPVAAVLQQSACKMEVELLGYGGTALQKGLDVRV